MISTHSVPRIPTDHDHLRELTDEFAVVSRRIAQSVAESVVRIDQAPSCQGTCHTDDRTCSEVNAEARRTAMLLIGELSRAKLMAVKIVHLRACPPRDYLMGIAARTHCYKTLAQVLVDLHLALLQLRGAHVRFRDLPAHAGPADEYDRIATALAGLLPDAMRLLSTTS